LGFLKCGVGKKKINTMVMQFMDNCLPITTNVLRLGGRFNAAKPLLYAGTVD